MNPLFVRMQEGGEDGPRAVAPAVGLWVEPPPAGAIVGPGSVVGRLRVLNKEYRLLLPDGAAGRVADPRRERVNPVGYGDTLFRLVPIAEAASDADPARSTGDLPGGVELPGGGAAVVAPTDGVFYRRPSPDSPPFVEVGSVVRTGQPIGLVEVMKTFNQIVYGGPGQPETAEVIEVRCEDGAEVSAGQVLVVTSSKAR